MISKKYSHLRLKILENNFEYVLFDSNEQMIKAIDVLNKNSADYLIFSFKGEKSMICSENDKSFEFSKSQDGWTGIKVQGEMPFGTVQGLISTISSPLAKEDIGICVVSTFLTDLFLIKKSNLEKVITILVSEGWVFER
jgi:hypothetical protein